MGNGEADRRGQADFDEPSPSWTVMEGDSGQDRRPGSPGASPGIEARHEAPPQHPQAHLPVLSRARCRFAAIFRESTADPFQKRPEGTLYVEGHEADHARVDDRPDRQGGFSSTCATSGSERAGRRIQDSGPASALVPRRGPSCGGDHPGATLRDFRSGNRFPGKDAGNGDRRPSTSNGWGAALRLNPRTRPEESVAGANLDP
jgi:hypothetical protein